MKAVSKDRVQLQYAYGDDKKMPNIIFSEKDLENIIYENQEYLETQYSGDMLVGVSIKGFLDMCCEDRHSFKNKNHIGSFSHKFPNLIAKLCKNR